MANLQIYVQWLVGFFVIYFLVMVAFGTYHAWVLNGVKRTQAQSQALHAQTHGHLNRLHEENQQLHKTVQDLRYFMLQYQGKEHAVTTNQTSNFNEPKWATRPDAGASDDYGTWQERVGHAQDIQEIKSRDFAIHQGASAF